MSHQAEALARPRRDAQGALPNVLIIGAPKCGTTSLHFYLDQHPSITMSARKELRYFSRSDWAERRDWYVQQFQQMRTPLRGESTPRYARYPQIPGVPARIHSLIPDVRLIYMVRDPVARIISQERQWWADGDRTPIDLHLEGWDRLENALVAPSRYATQLDQYLRHFPLQQLLVVDQHDLRNARRATLRRVFRFLGVDDRFETPLFGAERNASAGKNALTRSGLPIWNRVVGPAVRRLPEPARNRVRRRVIDALSEPLPDAPVIDAATRPGLEALLSGEANRLRELTGQSFASWSV
jgi:hypothetical protein